MGGSRVGESVCGGLGVVGSDGGGGWGDKRVYFCGGGKKCVVWECCNS